MSEAIDRPALNEIEITLVAVVPQPCAFAAHEDLRRAWSDIHQRIEWTDRDGHDELLQVMKACQNAQRPHCRVRPLRKLADLIGSASSSDTARPIIVERATTEACAEDGPVQCHGARIYPKRRRCQAVG